ncbi:uncharacterized protein LOC141850032 [Brevipalpus obovatus]|uniref:uncharacterized protein LOC141850032 n=1 Tax=Brevipalpus obovatus TaxID=246614 RepID=UPI003D9ED234
MQITEFSLLLTTFLLLITVTFQSVQNSLKNEDDQLEKICNNLLRKLKSEKELKNLLKSGGKSHVQHRGDRSSSDKKISIDRKNIVGQGGQLSLYSQFATDQASSTGSSVISVQQNENLIDSEAKYIQAELFLPITLRQDADEKATLRDLESKKIPLGFDTGHLVDTLVSKCEKRSANAEKSRQLLLERYPESFNLFRLPNKNANAGINSREYFPQESEGTDILANVRIAPDGDYADYVTTATGNSIFTNNGVNALLDQSHNKLIRSNGELVRITVGVPI